MYDWLLNGMNSLGCGKLAKEGEKKSHLCCQQVKIETEPLALI